MENLGYAGFDLPVAAVQTRHHKAEIDQYNRGKESFDKDGLEEVRFTTTVYTTRSFDPTSAYTKERRDACGYLCSCVEITSILDAAKDSWIPWDTPMLEIVPAYAGPCLVEVFNAAPPFVNLMRLARRELWIPGDDQPVTWVPSAHDVASDGIDALRVRMLWYTPRFYRINEPGATPPR